MEKLTFKVNIWMIGCEMYKRLIISVEVLALNVERDIYKNTSRHVHTLTVILESNEYGKNRLL